MIDFLDEEIPVIAGCPINDNPFNPICEDCKRKCAEQGDDVILSYVPRELRLIEKLATSDVSTADLVGEVDPVKVARGRTLDDESAIHFGLLPRAHRAIFAINELPDLAEKIQVAFFNIMEESDLQIKGFPVRLPLDIFIIATANPEDYTSRGRIITPLKDRFDVQIRTHFPREREHEIAIMEQELRRPEIDGTPVRVPQFIKEILAEITFQARMSPEINQHSGVSCRISIRSCESIMGSALRRSFALREEEAVPRITDLRSTYPAIAGKLEREYEVERSEEELVENLTRRAIKIVFDERFSVEELAPIIEAFNNGMSVEISQLKPSPDYMNALKAIDGMERAVGSLVDTNSPSEVSAAMEFILDGLHLSNKLNREEQGEGLLYR